MVNIFKRDKLEILYTNCNVSLRLWCTLGHKRWKNWTGIMIPTAVANCYVFSVQQLNFAKLS